MGRVAEAERGRIPEPPVDLDAAREVLGAEAAAPGSGRQRERPGRRRRVAELPGSLREVLLRDPVVREVPARDVAGEDQLGFQLVLVLVAGEVERLGV